MDEAASLFASQGYAATSLRHLAGTVGMKAGSLYYHFDSKDALLTEILHRGIQVMHDAFDAAAASSNALPAAGRIDAHVRAHLAALFENGPYTAAHLTTFRTAPDHVRQAAVADRDAYEERWTGLLDELADAGALAAGVSIPLARLMLIGAMNATVDWFDPDRSSLDHLAEQMTSQFWTGVAATPSISSPPESSAHPPAEPATDPSLNHISGS